MSALEPVEITAGRLHLRPWRPDDAEAVHAACQDPAVQRWTRVPVPYRREDAETYVGAVSEQGWTSGTAAHLAVVDAGSEQVLASVSLMGIAGGRAEVGAWAAPAARGRRVVPDAVQALARWAFGALDLVRLEWAAEVGNVASLRAGVHAGFRFEGRRACSMRRRDGADVDAWWLSRLASDGADGAVPVLPDPGVLRAGGLVLRLWRPDDAEAATAAMADDLFVPGKAALQGRPPQDAAQEWVADQAHEWWLRGAGVPVSVWDGDRLVGSLLLFRAGRRDGIAEVGVWVARAARGDGLARSALEALLEWAVPALGLARLEWVTTPDNAASQRLAARLGFVREGVAAGSLVQHGERVDGVVLGRVVDPTGSLR